MTRHKYTDAICIAIVIAMMIVTFAFVSGESIGITAAHNAPPYANRLFSTDKVHTIDIAADQSDWDNMIANATKEEYISASVSINGEKIAYVGIRPKGNSSLSTIAGSDSDRYSFKIEFDHYVSGRSYYGLDKLALNNIAQDNTYLKDYITYQMMNYAEADAPLSSFIFVTVNGNDWGLYLAVEGVEDAFANRNYGSDYGQIYKPDSMDMNAQGDENGGGWQMPGMAEDQMPDFGSQPPEGFEIPEGFEMPNFSGQMPQGDIDMPASDGQPPQDGTETADSNEQALRRDRTNPNAQGQNSQQMARGGEMPNFGGMGGGFGGMGGANDVALIYTDDNIDSYKNIFDGSVFNPSDQDKTRLISALKKLNEGDIENSINTDEVIRYFVVHNFALNSDSYTGSILHNYYLHEKDGKLSMIAWDYNLAFGGMGGMGNGGSSNTATSMANYPIDSPMLGGTLESRPMIGWIFNDEQYLSLYHEIFGEFIDSFFKSGEFEKLIDNTIALISPYVEKDPSAFCTYDEFLKASSSLKEFCLLRAESIDGQLAGTIPSTSEGQSADKSNLIDASGIDMNSMGSNMMGFGRARNNNNRQLPNQP